MFSYANGQTKEVTNKLDLVKNKITKKQSDLVFDKIKVFPENTQVSIAVIKDGEVSYFGAKRINDEVRYINNSINVFEIGSLTKLFTSTILSNFVLDSKLKLNDPIQKYFNFPVKNKEITILQLANHTAGLPKFPSNLDLEKADQTNPIKAYDESKLKEYITEGLDTITTPGTSYEYSNIGAGILGYLLTQHSNLSYEALLNKYIFSKYGMTNSTTNRQKIKKILIKGLDKDGEITANWDLNALVAAGGVLSNVEDLSKFALAQFNENNKELALTRVSTFGSSDEMEVGLAWKIIKPFSDFRWFAHNGGTGGYSSLIALDIEKRNGVIVLSNVSTFNEKTRNIDFLCFELMKSLVEK